MKTWRIYDLIFSLLTTLLLTLNMLARSADQLMQLYLSRTLLSFVNIIYIGSRVSPGDDLFPLSYQFTFFICHW